MDFPVCGSCSLRSRRNANYEGETFIIFSLPDFYWISNVFSICITSHLVCDVTIIPVFSQTHEVLLFNKWFYRINSSQVRMWSSRSKLSIHQCIMPTASIFCPLPTLTGVICVSTTTTCWSDWVRTKLSLDLLRTLYFPSLSRHLDNILGIKLLLSQIMRQFFY